MGTALVSKSMSLPVSVNNLDAYIRHVNAIPMLSADEEHSLALRFGENKDLEAAWALVMAHLRFVVSVARGYMGYGLPLGDLVQEGNVGLMKAVKRFDPDRGVRLVSFAVHWIRAEIHEFVLRNWRIVKVATTKAQRKLFFNLRGVKKRLGWLGSDEVDGVAKQLDVDAATVVEMESRLSGHDVAFDPYPDSEHGDDNPSAAPSAYLQEADADPGARLEREDWEDLAYKRLSEALEGLDARSRDILQRRWLREEKPTLHELAAEYGVSAERIRQIEAGAMKKLKSFLAPDLAAALG
jgi:RNA polymerase sigma-32 factor